MSIVDDPIDGGNAYEMYLTTESVDASVRPLGVASRCSRHAARGADVPPRPFTARRVRASRRDFRFICDSRRDCGVWQVVSRGSRAPAPLTQREPYRSLRLQEFV